MSSSQESKTPQTYMQRMMIALAMLSLAYILIVLSPNAYRLSLQSEIDAMKQAVPNDKSKSILDRAEKLYKITAVNTGAVVAMDEFAISFSETKGTGIWGASVLRIVENVKLMLYQMSYRLSLLLYWLILASPALCALCVEGFYVRKIKQHEFGVASTRLSRIWLKIAIFSFFIIDVYFIFPAAGSFGLYLPPAMFLVLGLALRYIMSNMSKIF